jgi:hypothetical protein
VTLLGPKHTNSKKESQFPKGDTNIREGVETKRERVKKEGNLKINLREKDKRKKEIEARRGLDSMENCGDNTATFFFQIQRENYRLPQVVSWGR